MGRTTKGNNKGSRKEKQPFPFGSMGGGSPGDSGNTGPFGGWKFRFSIIYILVLLGSLALFNHFFSSEGAKLVDYSEFKAKIVSGDIKRVEMDQNSYTGYPTAQLAPKGEATKPVVPHTAPVIYKTVPLYDPDFVKLLDNKRVSYYAVSQGGITLATVLSWVIPLLVIFIIWRMLINKMGNMGGNVLSFGQNRATIVAEGDITARFVDVAGVDEARDELVEVVDFLRTPHKYTDIGGKIPKGVLLVGPPGTGKTLLARAVAGEAAVPFFRMSGADFVEMFVGVGAARVRDLFKQAREKAPCIIFIDELDAIGKSRISGMAGGNDEREQTLNQLLVEMDGFDATSGLIILAATNRPDVLDPALLRPGRFDRQVLVDRPDLKGREAILAIHAKNVKLDPEAKLSSVARSTPGFVGADLANIVNEAALLAVRAGRKLVIQKDFEAAVEKSVAGLEKKNRVINESERKIVAWHETGHALVAGLTPGSDPVQKISIVPRGFGALGYTLQMPTEDRYLLTEGELLGKIDVLLGGRAAEELVFGMISTGASNDLTKATDIARRMITDYGMSRRFRNVALTQRGSSMMGQATEQPTLHREYAETTQQYIDEEIARIIEARYVKVKALIRRKKKLLDKVALLLLENETLDEQEFKALLTKG